MSDIGLSNARAEFHLYADQREVLGIDLPNERVVGVGLRAAVSAPYCPSCRRPVLGAGRLREGGQSAMIGATDGLISEFRIASGFHQHAPERWPQSQDSSGSIATVYFGTLTTCSSPTAL